MLHCGHAAARELDSANNPMIHIDELYVDDQRLQDERRPCDELDT